ncbi:cytochrome C [Palleronia sp. LCG004]|uniref:c-type cytochrome n=1 Tax=Palleronia sp. LCG004 TaxID=3079304 RepID=UPI0029436368|nr:cytochrome C [Palleronia sp. LCG004]WOI56173.1 cytochrome C [Palleronia sp. LCG004]
MRASIYLFTASIVCGAQALAQDHEMSGDPAAGEGAFNQCATCHVVTNDEGETLAGRNGRQGPNLYGVIGRQAGSVEGFRYGNSMVEAGEQGLVWDEENFVAYVQDPSGFLKEYLDDPRARGNMTYRVRDEEDAVNLAAFLADIGPEEDGVN